MDRVIQEIPSVNVVNVNVVGVVPAHGPGLSESEPVAAVLEARSPANYRGTVDAEHVGMTKVGTEAVIRYAATMVPSDLLAPLSMLTLLRGPVLLGLLRMLLRNWS